MTAALALAALLPGAAPSAHVSDSAPLVDPLRPVSEIRRDGFTLQYWTDQPAETRIELRRSDLPQTAFGRSFAGETRAIVTGPPGRRSWHKLRVSGLRPGTRYYYRIWDPSAKPTAQEALWGARDGWRREFAVSTQAPRGRKTIIRLPVKVLLMPNVVNVESAYADPANPAPPPPPMTPAEIQKIKDEYAVSARFLWVNSGMRFWPDYQFVVDERMQRWGPEPPNASGAYKGLPVSRSYAGKDFVGPGGGTWTFVDPKDPSRIVTAPFAEELPFSSQIEQAFPRRWNAKSGKWEFYNSGGGTFGVDEFPRGTPSRSQFLGGGDTAWLATHEFHHDMESLGQFSLSNRADDRIVFNHPTPRRRVVRPDGSVEEVTWTTNGPHGEHWNLMAYWDRTLSDAQWLRIYFGRTETVRDADEDGFPDDDPRLPLDEQRFGSSPRKKMTDGYVNDLAKAMESTWVPGPLQTSAIKPPFQSFRPNPTNPDSDGDGLIDRDDPYPLLPYDPAIVPMTARVDGEPSEWEGVPVAGRFDKGGIGFTFKQSHDENAYYGLFQIRGPWRRIDGTFDGEGEGVYSGKGVLGFQVTNRRPAAGAAQPDGSPIDVKPAFGGMPGLQIKARPTADGMTIEFSFPNRGAGPWYWTRGGQEIGVSLSVWDEQNRGYSVWEPYQLFVARMIEDYGKPELPADAPAELAAGAGVRVLRPGDPGLAADPGWTVEGGVASYDGQDEAALTIGGLKAREFDLLAVVEAKNDAILGGFTKSTKKPNAGEGYVGFVGGYGNTVTRLRIFGNEVGDEAAVLTPGPHRVQLTRRGGEIWLLLDGRPVGFAVDPSPKAIVDRLAILGGYGGAQVVREVRVRTAP